MFALLDLWPFVEPVGQFALTRFMMCVGKAHAFHPLFDPLVSLIHSSFLVHQVQLEIR